MVCQQQRPPSQKPAAGKRRVKEFPNDCFRTIPAANYLDFSCHRNVLYASGPLQIGYGMDHETDIICSGRSGKFQHISRQQSGIIVIGWLHFSHLILTAYLYVVAMTHTICYLLIFPFTKSTSQTNFAAGSLSMRALLSKPLPVMCIKTGLSTYPNCRLASRPYLLLISCDGNF